MKSDLVLQDLAPDVNLTCITEHPGFQPVCLQVESEISSGQVQNQREGKVSADRKRRKVSNIYYWLVLFLFEFTKTYCT